VSNTYYVTVTEELQVEADHEYDAVERVLAETTAPESPDVTMVSLDIQVH
jgi:hypothetical protein